MPNDQKVAQQDTQKPKTFEEWYSVYAKQYGVSPDPDDARHQYDYRGAFAKGAKPDESGHMPSAWKKPGHTNRFVQTPDGKVTDSIWGDTLPDDVAPLALERQKRLAAAQSMYDGPEYSDVPHYQQSALKSLFDVQDPTDWKNPEAKKRLQSDVDTIPTDPETAKKRFRPLPETLRGKAKKLTNSYLTRLASIPEDRVYTRTKFTPHEYVNGILEGYRASGKSVSAKAEQDLWDWADEFKSFETGGAEDSGRYAKRSSDEEELFARHLDLESGGLTPEQVAQKKAELNQAREAYLKKQMYGSLDNGQSANPKDGNWYGDFIRNHMPRGAAQIAAASDSGVGGYVPYLNEMVANAVDTFSPGFGKDRHDLFSDGPEGLLPAGTLDKAKEVGGFAGVLKSPLNNIGAPGVGALGKVPLKAAIGHSAALFTGINLANILADEVGGEFDGSDFNTYSERLAKDADEFAAGAGSETDPKIKQHLREKYISEHAVGFGKRATVAAANGAASGAVMGAAGALGGMVQTQAMRFFGWMPARVQQYLAKFVNQQITLNGSALVTPSLEATPGGVEAHAPLAMDLMDPAKRGAAFDKLLFNTVAAAFLGFGGENQYGTRKTDNGEQWKGNVREAGVHAIDNSQVMSGPDVEAFKQRLASDPELQKAFDFSVNAAAVEAVRAAKEQRGITTGRSLAEHLQEQFDVALKPQVEMISAATKELEALKNRPPEAAAAEAAAGPVDPASAPPPVDAGPRPGSKEDVLAALKAVSEKKIADAKVAAEKAKAAAPAAPEAKPSENAQPAAPSNEKPLPPAQPGDTPVPTADTPKAAPVAATDLEWKTQDGEVRRGTKVAEVRSAKGTPYTVVKLPDGTTTRVKSSELRTPGAVDPAAPAPKKSRKDKILEKAAKGTASPEELADAVADHEVEVGKPRVEEGPKGDAIPDPFANYPKPKSLDVNVAAEPVVTETSDKAAFLAALKKNSEGSEHGAFVSVPDDPAFYKDHKTFMGPHGETVAVSPDGDIVAVSKGKDSPTKGWADAALRAAKKAGGNRMDNFDRPAGSDKGLPDLYAKHGFKAVARVPWNPEYAPKNWRAEHGTPDVVFMAHDGKTPDGGVYTPGEGAKVSDYDSGVAAQKAHAARSELKPSEVVAAAKAGGGTFDPVTGEQPKSGFSVAVDKSIETRIPEEEFSEADVEKFRKDHAAELAKAGRHLGVWRSDGDIFLDVSAVLKDRAAALEYAREREQESIYDLGAGDTIRTLYVGPGGRKMGYHQHRVEAEIAEAASKTDGGLSRDPVAVAVGTLLAEAKMKTLASANGKHLDDVYRDVRVRYMSALDYLNWVKSGRGGGSDTMNEWTGKYADKYTPRNPDKDKDGNVGPIIHPITGKVYTRQELGKFKVRYEDVLDAAMAGASNRFWYTDARDSHRRYIPQEDRALWNGITSAASIGNDPKTQVQNARDVYLWYRAKRASGLSHEQIAKAWREGGRDEVPGLRGKTADSVVSTVATFLETGAINGKKAPKVHAYWNNLTDKPGEGLVTRDRWDFRFLGLSNSAKLTKEQREVADAMYQRVAEDLSQGSETPWSPAEVQAAIWLTMKWRAHQQKQLTTAAKWLHERGVNWNVLDKMLTAGDDAGVANYMDARTAKLPGAERREAYRRLDRIRSAREQRAVNVPDSFNPTGKKMYRLSDAMDEVLGSDTSGAFGGDRTLESHEPMTNGADRPAGMVTFMQDGKALVRLLDKADVGTISHEFGHIVSHYLPPEYKARLKSYFGRPEDEPLSVTEEEILARLYEVYDTSGKAPTEELEGVFEHANDWMAGVLSKVTPNLRALLKAQGKPLSRKGGSELLKALYEAGAKAETVDGAAKTPEVQTAAEDVQRSMGLEDADVKSTADVEAVETRAKPEPDERVAEGAPKNHDEVLAAAAKIRAERPEEKAADAIPERDLPVEEPDAEVADLAAALKLKDEARADDADTAEPPPKSSGEKPNARGVQYISIPRPDEAGKSTFEQVAADRNTPAVTHAEGDVLRVTLKNGDVYTGRFGGTSDARVIIGRNRIRRSDVADMAKVTRPVEEGLIRDAYDAMKSGDHKRLAALEADIQAQRAKNSESDLASGTTFFDDPTDAIPPAHDVTLEDFKEMESMGLARNRRPSSPDHPETVEIGGGMFEVHREGRGVRLVPATAASFASAPPSVGGIPSRRGDNAVQRVMDRVEKGVHKVEDATIGFVVDRAFDAAHWLLTNPGNPLGRWVRKNFTELGHDVEIENIKNRSAGRRAVESQNILIPVLREAERLGYAGKDKAKSAELAKHLFEGTTPSGPAGKLVEAIRSAFDHYGQRMVEEGLISQETFESHKGKYFPLLNWTKVDISKLEKDIRGLEAKKASGKTLTSEEAVRLRDNRAKVAAARSAMPLPDGLIHRFGDVKTNVIDSREVVGAASRTRARKTVSLEEATNKGWSSDAALQDVVRAMTQEAAAVERLTMFREIREYGLNHPDRLVLPPVENGADLPGYVRLGGKTVNYSGMKSFGALDGHYVKDSLWSMLEVYAHHPSEVGRAWDILHAFLKKGKTTWRLGGHVVQRIGNPIIWMMHGVPMFRIPRIARDGRAIVNRANHDITVEFNGKQVPATSDFLAREGVLVPDQIPGGIHELDPVRSKDLNGDIGVDGFVENITNALGHLIPGGKALEKTYGLPDQYSRAGLYVYMRNHEGLTHKEAVSKVRMYYDVNNVPSGIKGLSRQWSFFRFQYLMMRNSREMLKRTPWAMTKVLGLMAGIRAVHRGALGMSSDEYEKALYAAYPGDDFGAMIKRMTAMPSPIPEMGGGNRNAGWFSIWNMFPQQTMLQYVPGMSNSPAEEKAGGSLKKWVNIAIGSQSLIWKPITEIATNRDSWSGQARLMQTRYGARDESEGSMWGAAAKHIASNWMPSIMSDGYRAAEGVADSAGAPVPRAVSIRQRDAEGNLPSATDEIARAAGIPIRRPDNVRADIVRKRQALSDDPATYADEDGQFHPRSTATPEEDARVKAASDSMKDTLNSAAGNRALGWLRDGDVEEAAKEIRTSARLKQILRDLDDKRREELLSHLDAMLPFLK